MKIGFLKIFFHLRLQRYQSLEKTFFFFKDHLRNWWFCSLKFPKLPKEILESGQPSMVLPIRSKWNCWGKTKRCHDLKSTSKMIFQIDLVGQYRQKMLFERNKFPISYKHPPTSLWKKKDQQLQLYLPVLKIKQSAYYTNI